MSLTAKKALGMAFPFAVSPEGYYSNGMTLRDYFAAKAMTAMVAGEGARMIADRDKRYDETNWKEVVASNAYDFADAMMEERKKPKSDKL